MGLTDFYKTNSTSEKHDEQPDNGSFSSGSDSEPALIQVDKNVKQIGYVSATFLMINRMLGAGVFSTGSTIFALSGSVGTALMMWFAGTIIALSGLLVYMELGSALPRNGGEKNYLEYLFKKPKFLVTAMYASYVFFLGWAAGNSIVVGEYILNAAGKEVTQWNSRGIGIAVITFAFLINAINVKAGLFLANSLGIFKVGIVLFITVTGWVALGGGIKTNNFEPTHNFSHAFSGESPTGFGIVNSLYNVIWSYVGYSNANYALGEIKNPVKVLRVAAPTAFVFLGIIYMFVNIAYFAVVPKEEIASSGRILAASFFKYAFGDRAEKAASVFVALSAWANVMSVIFSQGRIIQQLGREGSLPFSRFFATSRPFNTPFVGLFQHWIVCIITIVAPPPGDAYNFILNNPVEQSASSYRVVTEHIKSLVVEKCWFQTPRSVYVICSLLILTTWPLPNNTSKITDNLCVKFISTMKSLSLQFGLHKLEFIDEFSHKTKINISQEVNLDNMIRERIYKFININSNYWLINLGLSNNNYNGFTQDYIINKATNIDILNKTNEGDQYINSLLKISMIQSKLNENMNDLVGSTSDSSLLLPNQLNISKLINFNMFEIIIDDLNKILVREDNSVVLNNLIKISIEFTKLQLFVYSLSKSDITVDEYKRYINKILTSCLIIFSSQFEDNSLNFNQLPIHYKFPIKLALFFMIRVFKSPILSSLGDYKLVKEKFNQMYNNILMGGKNHNEWSFLNARLIKVIQKFNEVDNCYIISKMQRRNSKNEIVPSFFLINQMKSYLILSLNYELIWLVYENENSKSNRTITDINWDNFGIKGNKKEFVDYISSNESIFY